MYDRSSQCENTNDVRQDLFTQKGRAIDAIPPTYAALYQHTQRAAYQAGYCWGQALCPSPTLPSPAEHGWTKEADLHSPWKPLWTTLLPASNSCMELLKCGCDKDKGCRVWRLSFHAPLYVNAMDTEIGFKYNCIIDGLWIVKQGFTIKNLRHLIYAQCLFPQVPNLYSCWIALLLKPTRNSAPAKIRMRPVIYLTLYHSASWTWIVLNMISEWHYLGNRWPVGT